MSVFSIVLLALVIAFLFYTMDMIYKMSQDVKYIRRQLQKT